MKEQGTVGKEELTDILKEKLKWFQESASEEEFDAEEVSEITQILDILETQPANDFFDKERAYKRFQEKYLQEHKKMP